MIFRSVPRLQDIFQRDFKTNRYKKGSSLRTDQLKHRLILLTQVTVSN